MKVYHRKVLFLTLIIGFGGIVYFGGRFLQGDTLGIVWMIIFAILTKQGLSIALTEKGSARKLRGYRYPEKCIVNYLENLEK